MESEDVGALEITALGIAPALGTAPAFCTTPALCTAPALVTTPAFCTTPALCTAPALGMAPTVLPGVLAAMVLTAVGAAAAEGITDDDTTAITVGVLVASCAALVAMRLLLVTRVCKITQNKSLSCHTSLKIIIITAYQFFLLWA